MKTSEQCTALLKSIRMTILVSVITIFFFLVFLGASNTASSMSALSKGDDFRCGGDVDGDDDDSDYDDDDDDDDGDCVMMRIVFAIRTTSAESPCLMSECFRHPLLPLTTSRSTLCTRQHTTRDSEFTSET